MAQLHVMPARMGDYYAIGNHALIHSKNFWVIDGQVWEPKQLGSLFVLLKGWLDASDTAIFTNDETVAD